MAKLKEIIEHINDQIAKAEDIVDTEKHSAQSDEYYFFLGKKAAYEDVLKQLDVNGYKLT